MNVYVESNFVLELALLQEQRVECASILAICIQKHARLVIPAYSLAEPYETLIRHRKSRERLREALEDEFRQLRRTAAYASRSQEFEEILALLASSSQEESVRLESVRSQLLESAEVIPLDHEVLVAAAESRLRYSLKSQDAIVYASVLNHLRRNGASRSCFVTRDSDFLDPAPLKELGRHGCKVIPSFKHGDRYLSSVLGNEGPET